MGNHTKQSETEKRNKTVTNSNQRRTRIGAFVVAPYPHRRDCWKVDIDKKVFGNARRKFFSGPAAEPSAISWAAGENEKYQKGLRLEEPSASPRTADSSRSVNTAAVAYINDKDGEVCAEQLRLIKNHLGKFCGRFGGLDIDTVEPFECKTWLKGLAVSQRTRHGIFGTCRTFYRWAMRYNRARSSPFERMEPIPKGDPPKAILEPEEMRALLSRQMPDYVRAWLVLGGFCGLRPVEIERSDWSAVNWDAGEFHVRPEATKRDRIRNRGLRERIVQMPAAALRLLPRGLKGPIIPVSKNPMQDQVRQLAVALATMRGQELRKRKARPGDGAREVDTADWPHDCLRHSAATYKLGVEADAGPVAQFLGHTTTKMVHDNYARPKSKAVAEAWWAIGLNDPELSELAARQMDGTIGLPRAPVNSLEGGSGFMPSV